MLVSSTAPPTWIGPRQPIRPGTDLSGVVLDRTATPRPAEPDGWRPAPEPSDLAQAAGAIRRLVANPVAHIRTAAVLIASAVRAG